MGWDVAPPVIDPDMRRSCEPSVPFQGIAGWQPRLFQPLYQVLCSVLPQNANLDAGGHSHGCLLSQRDGSSRRASGNGPQRPVHQAAKRSSSLRVLVQRRGDSRSDSAHRGRVVLGRDERLARPSAGTSRDDPVARWIPQPRSIWPHQQAGYHVCASPDFVLPPVDQGQAC